MNKEQNSLSSGVPPASAMSPTAMRLLSCPEQTAAHTSVGSRPKLCDKSAERFDGARLTAMDV